MNTSGLIFHIIGDVISVERLMDDTNKCQICQKEFIDLTSFIMHQMYHNNLKKEK